MDARTAIGYTLYALRYEQGLTLSKLSARTKVGLSYISELEHGKKEASSEVLSALAAGLEVSVGWILTESGRLLTEWEGYLTSPDLERSLES